MREKNWRAARESHFGEIALGGITSPAFHAFGSLQSFQGKRAL
jgi:hypothetical protein